MKHNPMMKRDNFILTYSDIKDNSIKIYSESWCESKNDFNSFIYLYPEDKFLEIKGYSKAEIEIIMQDVRKLAPIAYEYEKNKEYEYA
ncbi:hypothetical protein SAMN02745111_02451 [Eubacterium uniforme]|uniref:Uncharacterized protein n=2 Tax=Eubacterium uniforme TaxID=39495 RepID=A0A1T4W739_9FIRM|nr:hypothetical protein SAMN02745111_02451 [Eubacterium uniforme]